MTVSFTGVDHYFPKWFKYEKTSSHRDDAHGADRIAF